MYPAPQSSSWCFHFDEFEADTQTAELRLKGERVPLQEVPFRFLAALLERPGELVSREQLRESIWPVDVNLDFESALDTAASKVRHALGDSAKAPRYLETLPGKGYRFLGEVRTEGRQPQLARGLPLEGKPPRERRVHSGWEPGSILVPETAGPRTRRIGSRALSLAVLLLLAGAGGFLLWRSWHLPPGAARASSVLVLPSKVLGSPESAFLSDAIPNTLSTLLAGVEGLETKVPPTAAQVEKVQGDLAKIVRAYGSEKLVLSTITAQGERLVLNVMLADAGDLKVRWAAQFEGNRATYTELSRQAAEALARVLQPGATPGKASLASSEVELALAEGRAHMLRYEDEGQEESRFERAKADFLRALAADPRCARAAARMAFLCRIHFIQCRQERDLSEAEGWIRRALEQDPRCAEAWYAATWVAADRKQRESAYDCALKAAYYGPGDARFQASLADCVTGPGSSAMYVTLTRRALELDPLSDNSAESYVMALNRVGRNQEALGAADRALVLHPENVWLQTQRAKALIELGRLGEAEEALHRWQGDLAKGLIWVRELGLEIRFVLLAAKNEPAARAQGRALVARYRATVSDPYTIDIATVNMVPGLVRLGMVDEALGLLQRHLDFGGSDLDWLCEHPELRKLHGDPRFTPILEGARNGAKSIVRAFQRAKARGELPAHLEGPLAELQTLLKRSLDQQ